MTHWGTMKMTPEFMKELDDMEKAQNPGYQDRRTYMSVTTDGSDVSREEVEAQMRKWVQARINKECETMKSFPEEPRQRRTAAELIASLGDNG